jgi:hypothetical protein
MYVQLLGPKARQNMSIWNTKLKLPYGFICKRRHNTHAEHLQLKA